MPLISILPSKFTSAITPPRELTITICKTQKGPAQHAQGPQVRQVPYTAHDAYTCVRLCALDSDRSHMWKCRRLGINLAVELLLACGVMAVPCYELLSTSVHHSTPYAHHKVPPTAVLCPASEPAGTGPVCFAVVGEGECPWICPPTRKSSHPSVTCSNSRL